MAHQQNFPIKVTKNGDTSYIVPLLYFSSIVIHRGGFAIVYFLAIYCSSPSFNAFKYIPQERRSKRGGGGATPEFDCSNNNDLPTHEDPMTPFAILFRYLKY